MGPFVRDARRSPGSASKLPQLKPQVRRIFVAYMILTIPVLVVLAFLLLWNLPRLADLLVDGLRRQADAFSAAWDRGNVLSMAVSGAQMLILALEVVGGGLILYKLVWSPARSLWTWSKPTWRRRVAGLGIAAGVVALVAALWAPYLPFGDGDALPAGTQRFDVTERGHVETPVLYPEIPPVGGNHAPVWQNCGFYGAPVSNENAVHSLEHGAVWITYRPDLPASAIAELRDLADDQTYVLVTPYPDLPAAVIASAWGYQLRLDSAADDGLDEFVRRFRQGSQAPEQGGPCTGGTGQPA
jgi:hypothetical protein